MNMDENKYCPACGMLRTECPAQPMSPDWKCRLGFHQWLYSVFIDKKICKKCGKSEHY